ncbi:hypothetical protein LTR36_006990 [Oleoguttula mirabilis]|uniref:F-box domain-containing protein n=1 Tax=Oleoguttula mirabilis TaxID=1507867 RepID=A0AAV9JCK2_9PEZI|nr:hypothetical protein LTR36_006990 [Oleoguttula mirabilis]
MTATSAVFGTAELLDLILFQLPTTDLVRASGVSREWRDALKTTSMKQKLFLSPVATSPISLRWVRKQNESLTGFEDADELYGTRITSDFSLQKGGLGARQPPQVIKLHPLLERYNDKELYRDVELGFWVRDLLKYEALGQWSETFISQPPVRGMSFSLLACGASFEHKLVLQDDGGLKLRRIQEAIQSGLKKLEESLAAQYADPQGPEVLSQRKLAGYDGYLGWAHGSLGDSLRKWGESAPGLAVCTIRDCIADVSDRVTSAVTE